MVINSILLSRLLYVVLNPKQADYYYRYESVTGTKIHNMLSRFIYGKKWSQRCHFLCEIIAAEKQNTAHGYLLWQQKYCEKIKNRSQEQERKLQHSL